MKERMSKKLNIGCGYDYRQGYVNVDLQPKHQPDVVASVTHLDSFPSNFYEEIIAQDVLEHVVREDVRRALFEWNRLLVPGGRIFIRTTEVRGICRLLESPEFQDIASQESLIQSLFGTQAYTGDFHLNGFTERLFRFYLWEAGFEVEQAGLVHGAFLDAWARKVRDLSFESIMDIADNGEFVQRAIAAVLERPARSDEIVRHLEALTADSIDRREIVKRLLLSDERKQRMIAAAPAFPQTLRFGPPPRSLFRSAGGKIKRILRGILSPRARSA